MRKIIAVLLTALIIASMVSCGLVKPEPTAEETTQTAEPTASETTSAPTDDGRFEITVKSEDFSENGCSVTLKYPVLSDMTDGEKQDRLNKMIRDYVYDQYKSKNLVGEDGNRYFYNMTDAVVTYSSYGPGFGFISVRMIAEFYSSDDFHADYAGFTLNCSIADEKLLSSADIFSDYDSVAKLFTDGRFIMEYGNTDILSDMTLADIISRYSSQYKLYPYVYFENGRLGMNIDVSHLYGGCVGFTVDISEIADYLESGIITLTRTPGHN